MKIILTGSEGNLGSHINKLLEFDFLKVDRGNWGQLNSIQDSYYNAVIHCAYDLKNNITEKPDEVLESNIISTAQLLRVCKEKKIPQFVFISSCAVYGDSSNSAEDKVCLPVSLNGHTKLFNEELVKHFCKANGINYLILRVFNTYGGSDQFSVVQKLINCAINKTTFTVVNEGVSERDFIHVWDVAKIVGKLLNLNLKNEIINVGSGESVKIADILSAVEKKIGSIEIIKKTNTNEAIFSRANVNKLNSLVKYEAIDILEFIDSM